MKMDGRFEGFGSINSLTVTMEKFNADLQKRYTNLKKRKLIQLVNLNNNSEEKACQLVAATEEMLQHEGKKTDHLFQKLLFCHDKLAEREAHVLEQTKKMNDLSSEVTKLQNSLSQKNEATVIIEPTIRESPQAIISEEEDKATQNEESCCRCISNGHGDEIVRDSISDILRTLIESVPGMRVSFGQQSAEVIHEKSGYAFSLTWSTDGNELVYRVSSLGTLDKIALKWMEEEIIFNTTMCPKFFERICGIIGRA